MNEDQVLFITEYAEEEIQSFAEANFGRELTEIELEKLNDCAFDDDKIFWARMELLARIIEAVMRDED